MNKQRRKEIERALLLLGEAKEILESVREDENDAYDNLPESIQYSERGEAMCDCVDMLDSGLSDLDDFADALSEVAFG